jgi:enoyl-CoA hydratase/carnithine racemase
MEQGNSEMRQKTFTQEKDGAIAILTLSRAHCLDIEGKRILTEAIHELANNQALRAVVLTARHAQAWLVNVEELAEMSPHEARAFSRSGHRLGDALTELPVPVVAAIDQVALGGGCELALACDLILSGPSARFGQIEAMGGVLPAFGGTWRLAQRVGHQRALRMLYTAETVDAETAKSMGLVLDVVPSAELMDHVRALTAQIAGVSRQSVAAIKRVVNAGVHLAPSAIAALEEEAFAGFFGTDDQRTRMRNSLASQAKANKEVTNG